MIKVLRKVFRAGLLIGIAVQYPAWPAIAQTTSPKGSQPVAPSLRELAGDDAKKAEELRKAINNALADDRWDEAITLTEESLALRTRVQGPKHFEIEDAEWLLKTLRRVAPMSKEDRAAYRSALTMQNQAATLNAQGKYAAGPAALREGARSSPPTPWRRQPLHLRKLQQPGSQPQRPGEVRGGPAALREGAGDQPPAPH